MAYSHEDYLKAINKMRSNYQNYGSSSLVNTMDDSTYVGEELSSFAYMNTPLPSTVENQKSSGSDRNWWQKIWDTSAEMPNNVKEGFLGFFDGIFDFAVNVAGEVSAFLGGDKEWTKDVTNYDWQAQVLKATNFFDFNNIWSGDFFTKDYWTRWDAEYAREQLNKNHEASYVNYLGDDAHNFLNGLEYSLGNQLPSIMFANIAGGAASAAGKSTDAVASISKATSLTSMGLGAYTSATNEAYAESGDFGKANLYGLANMAIEVGSELVVGKVLDTVHLGTNKVMGVVGKSTSKGEANFIKEMAKTMFEEGVEEAVSGILEPVAKSIYKGEDAFKTEDGQFIYFDKDFWFGGSESVAGQALSGAISGGILGGVSISERYKALGPNGVNIENLSNENKSLYKDLSKYDKGSTKYNSILEEISKNTAKISYYLAQAKSENNSTHLNNIALLLSDPQSFYNAMNSQDGKQINQLIDSRINELKNVDQFGTRNFFNELQERYGTDYQLEFADLDKNNNAMVDHSKKTIVINSKLSDTLAPVLAHEYLGHVIGDSLSINEINSIYSKIIDTDWYKSNKKALSKAYKTTESYQKSDSITQERTYKGEVINKYIENSFKRDSNSKSISAINKAFANENILNKIIKYFKKNGKNLQKSDAIVKEFSRAINNIVKSNNSLYKVIQKVLANKKLNAKENEIYEQNKDVIDFLKQYENYSKENGKNYSYESMIKMEDTKIVETKQLEIFKPNEILDNKKVKSILKEIRNKNNMVLNKYLDEKINVTMDGLKHYFGTRLKNIDVSKANAYISIISNINEILSNAVPLNEVTASNENVKTTYVLGAIAKIEGQEFAIRFVVKKYSNVINEIDINNLYSINQKESEQHGLTPLASPSNISISDFLEIATKNQLLRSSLSNDVLNHYGLERDLSESKSDKVATTLKYSKSLENNDVKYSKNLDAAEETKVIKDSANLRKEKVYNLKTTEHILKNILENLRDKLPNNVSIKLSGTKESFVSKAFKDINLSKNINEEVSKVMDMILNANVTINKGTDNQATYKLGDYVDEKIKSDLNKCINGLIAHKGSESQIKKLTDRYLSTIDRLNSKISELRHRTEYLVDSIKTINSLNNKFKNTKTMTATGDVAVEEIQLYSNFVKGIKLSKTSKGISPKSINNLVSNFETYTQENFEDSILGFNNDLKQLVDSFKESFENGTFPNRELTLEETRNFNNIMKMIKHDVKVLQSEKTAQMVKMVENTHKQVSFIKDNVSLKGNAFDYVGEKFDSAIGAPAYIAKYLGNNSDFYKLLTIDYRRAYNRELIVYNKFLNEAVKTIPSELGIKDINKVLKGKVKFKGNQFTINQLLHIYATLQTAKDDVINNGLALYNEKTSRVEILKYSQEEINELMDLIPEEYKKYADTVIKESLNKTCKEYLLEKYKENTGIEPSLRDVYYPVSRAQLNNNGLESLNSYDKGFLTTSNLGFLKERKANHAPIQIRNFTSTIDHYFNKLAFYGEKTAFIDKYRTILNKKINGTSVNSLFNQILPNWANNNKGKGWSDYLNKIILERSVSDGKESLFDKAYGNGVSAVLGANISTALKQTLSEFAYAAEVGNTVYAKTLLNGIGNIAKGQQISSIIEENSGYFAKRWSSNEVFKSNNGLNDSKFIKAFGFAMEYVDKKVITSHGWAIAQFLAKEQGAGEYWTESNNKLAVQILEDIVLRTQSNSDPMNLSMLRSGYNGKWTKELFGIFGADNQNKLQFFKRIIGEHNNSIKRIQAYEKALQNNNLTEEERTYYENQIKLEKTEYTGQKHKTRVVGTMSAMVASGIATVAISELVKRLLGRKEWDELDSQEFIKDAILETLVNWFPYIGTISNALNNNSDLTLFTLERLNEAIDVAQQFSKAFQSGDLKEWRKALFDGLIKISELFGIPSGNLYNLAYGILYNINKEAGLNFKNWTKGYSSSYIKSTYTEAISNKQYSKANAALKSWSMLYSINLSNEEANEIVSLAKDGYSFAPKANLTSYEDEKGNKIELTSAQKQEFYKDYYLASNAVKELLKIDEYRKLDSESKAKILKKIYDAYYGYAKNKILKTQSSSRIEKLMLASNGKIGLSKLLIGVNALSSIAATKNNTRKELVLKAINKMRGYSKVEKLMILYLAGYSLSEENTNTLKVYIKQHGGNKELIDSL